MATTVTVLRRLIDEPTTDVYADAELQARLDAVAGDGTLVARDVWAEKMAAASSLVDISEGGSQRKMSQAYDHAKAMWDHYNELVLLAGDGNSPVLRRITRV